MIPCVVYQVVGEVLRLYSYVMLAYAIVSWLPSLRGAWTRYLSMLVEPVLAPVRRIIPPIGGFDISFIVVILAINWAAGLALNASACYYSAPIN